MIEVLKTMKESIESLHGTEAFNALAPMLPAIDELIRKASLSQGIGDRPWCEGPYKVTPSKEDHGTFHIRGPMGTPTQDSAPYTVLVLEQAPVMADLMIATAEVIYIESGSRESATPEFWKKMETSVDEVKRWYKEFSDNVDLIRTREKK